jgi:hypothetical protein
MPRSPVRRALHLLVFATAMPVFLLGCPKKPMPAQEDAAPPPPASSQPVLDLAPDMDAGDQVDASDAGKKWTGPGMNPNEAKVRQCCNALAALAGTDPTLKAAVAQCYVIAQQVGSKGTAPEFAGVRALLMGKTLPGSCAGL